MDGIAPDFAHIQNIGIVCALFSESPPGSVDHSDVPLTFARYFQWDFSISFFAWGPKVLEFLGVEWATAELAENSLQNSTAFFASSRVAMEWRFVEGSCPWEVPGAPLQRPPEALGTCCYP